MKYQIKNNLKLQEFLTKSKVHFLNLIKSKVNFRQILKLLNFNLTQKYKMFNYQILTIDEMLIEIINKQLTSSTY